MAIHTGILHGLFLAVFFVGVKSTTKHAGKLKILNSSGDDESPVKPSIQITENHSDVDDESNEKNDPSDIPEFISESLGLGVKRQFDPWGGKRVSYNFLGQPDTTVMNKKQFSPWGGKRNLPESKFPDERQNKGVEEEEEDEEDGASSHGHKRNFHAWGGKRNINPWSGNKSHGSLDSKRNFNAWGGKRTFNSWGGKRTFNSWGGKKSFSPWGGKGIRLGWNEGQNASQPDDIKDFDPWSSKKSFNSWGGKRNFALPSRTRDFRHATSVNGKML